jgi:hypothetical protein
MGTKDGGSNPDYGAKRDGGVRPVQERQWLLDNRDAITSYNEWIEEHGLPLDEFRQF